MTDIANTSDAKLAAQCRAGDEDAWREFIRRFGPLMYGIMHRFNFSSEERDDIFGHVCLLILRHINELRRDNRIAAYVATTTYHECLARVKELNRYADPGLSQHHLDQLTEAAPDQEQLITQAQREHLLNRGLGQLDQRCRQLLEMLFYESPTPTYVEIAERLGVKTSAVGPIRGRCLTRLRTLLKQLGFEKL